ncbi:MAG: hypothetical protein ACI9FN_001258 [Saprospiraceae bacterium]|jgi:hypothetical protein
MISPLKTNIFQLRLLFLLSSLLLISILNSQVKFYATTDAKQIVAGNYFDVSFTLENARSQQFKAPSFVNFEIVGGPNSSTQMTIINGRTSQKMTYSYTLTSNRIGHYSIGPAEITVNGQSIKSNPIAIEVLKGKAPTKNPDGIPKGDIILEAHVDHQIGYVGQQITLRYDLYTTLDVRSYNFSKLPAFDGFFAQELQGYNGRTERLVKDGVQYVKRTVKVIALFPQQKGSYNFDPARAVLGISTGKSSNNFFFSRRLKQVNASSTGFNLNITDLPKGAPESFSGAVGNFQMGSAVDKKSITMDDAVTLTLQVRGVGDGKFIEAPTQPFSDKWDIYEPNLLKEEQKAVGAEIQYTKTFEYLMIPKELGRLQFRPEFTYFDTDSSMYFRIQGDRYNVNVTKGTGRELADIQTEEIALTPIYTSTRLKNIGSTFAFSWGHGIGNLSLGLAALGLLLFKRKEIERNNIDPAIIRNERAQKLAIAKLSEAKKALDKGDVTQFYIQLRKGLTSYLADKTNRASDQLSKEDISNLLQQHNLSNHKDELFRIMEKGEQAIYAATRPGDEEASYQRTIEIVKEIEAAFISIKEDR